MIAGLAIVYGLFIWRGTFTWDGGIVGTLFDDALISLRYAGNLAGGHGLVWNPGEVPPVEGYSNLGWTLLMAPIAGLFPREIAPIVVSLAGAVIIVRSGIVTRRLLADIEAAPRVAMLGMFLACTCFPLVFWTLRGMEVGLVALLLLEGTAVAVALSGQEKGDARRSIVKLSVLAGLAFLVRNDAVILFAPHFVVAMLFAGGARNLLLAAIPVAAFIVAQLAFRNFYHHELVPNTYVLKMTGVSASVRLDAGLTALARCLPALLVLMLMGGILWRPGRSVKSRVLQAIGIATAAIQSLYLVWIGGDAWSFDYSNRFIATVTPLLMTAIVAASVHEGEAGQRGMGGRALGVAGVMSLGVLIATGVLDLGPRSNWAIVPGWLACVLVPGVAEWVGSATSQRAKAAAQWVVVLGMFLVVSAPGWIRFLHAGAPVVRDDIAFARQGLFLRERLPPDALIAASWLGAPSYYSGLRSVDILGKVDKVIARLPGALPFHPGHNKVDLRHSVGTLRPDVVLYDAGEQVGRFGYERLGNGLWVNAKYLQLANGQRGLGATWCNRPDESRFCPRFVNPVHEPGSRTGFIEPAARRP